MKAVSRLTTFLPVLIKTSSTQNHHSAFITSIAVSHHHQNHLPNTITHRRHFHSSLPSLKASLHVPVEPTTPNTMSSKIPSPPFSYASANNNFLDLTELNTLITQNDTNRQGAYDLSSKIKSALVHARASFERNLPRDEREVLQTTLEVLIQQALQLQADGSDGKPTQTRLANLGFTFGDYVQHKAYAHFLQTGTLIPQSVLPSSLADEEYLSGIISLNQDVARYAIGRATERDVKSVLLARDLVSSVLDHLMKYDFRNGNLRRKYGE